MKIMRPPITFWPMFNVTREENKHMTNEAHEDLLTLTRTDEKSEKHKKESHFADLCNQETVDLQNFEKD